MNEDMTIMAEADVTPAPEGMVILTFPELARLVIDKFVDVPNTVHVYGGNRLEVGKSYLTATNKAMMITVTEDDGERFTLERW